jgi:hypothetical protein
MRRFGLTLAGMEKIRSAMPPSEIMGAQSGITRNILDWSTGNKNTQIHAFLSQVIPTKLISSSKSEDGGIIKGTCLSILLWIFSWCCFSQKNTNKTNWIMASQDHIAILKSGVQNWNKWREENKATKPDLENAQLREVDLRGETCSTTFPFQSGGILWLW